MSTGDGAQVKVGIRQLLAWLINRVGQETQTLFFAIIFWLSAVIEGCPGVAGASTDPFDAPSLKGPSGRALKISNAKRSKIVRLSASGGVFKSGRSVLTGARLLGRDIGAEHANTANRWVWPYMLQYMHALLTAFHCRNVLIPIYSIAWDATRLSKLEVMASAVYNHGLKLAGWCPPQVVLVCLFDIFDDFQSSYSLLMSPLNLIINHMQCL